MQKRAIIPWRERAYISIDEAAQIVARSPDWIRRRIGEQRISAARLMPAGPIVVDVPSLLNFLNGVQPVRELKVPPPKLRLVVSDRAN